LTHYTSAVLTVTLGSEKDALGRMVRAAASDRWATWPPSMMTGQWAPGEPRHGGSGRSLHRAPRAVGVAKLTPNNRLRLAPATERAFEQLARCE